MAVRRGEVWLVTLNPTIGNEIRKTRPSVIISLPEMHDYLRTVLIVPMTAGRRPAPFRIPVRFQSQRGLVLLDQLRVLDQQRLARRLAVVGHRTLELTLARLRDMFADSGISSA